MDFEIDQMMLEGYREQREQIVNQRAELVSSQKQLESIRSRQPKDAVALKALVGDASDILCLLTCICLRWTER